MEGVTMSTAHDLPEKQSLFGHLVKRISLMSAEQQQELRDMIEERWGKSHRQHKRRVYFTSVDYVVDGQYYRDFLQDLSLSGLFIQTRHPFSPGQKISLTFASPVLQTPFKIAGTISRVIDDEGIGVQFNKTTQVQNEILTKLIDQILPVTK